MFAMRPSISTTTSTKRAKGELPGAHTAARHLNECGRASPVHNLCADLMNAVASELAAFSWILWSCSSIIHSFFLLIHDYFDREWMSRRFPQEIINAISEVTSGCNRILGLQGMAFDCLRPSVNPIF